LGPGGGVKLLAVVPLYPPHHLGGYEVVCRGVMERLADHGHEVMVLTSQARFAGRPEEGGGHERVTVKRALRGWWDWNTHQATQPSVRERISVERHNRRVVDEVLERFRPDVASIWSLVYLSLSVATRVEGAGVPVVLSLGDNWICYAPALDAWTRMLDGRPWMRPLARLAGLPSRLPTFGGATATAASAMIRDTVATTSRWRFPDIAVVPMGVDTREFPLCEPRHGAWRWRLLYVGRIVEDKGVATALRALALLPGPAQLVVDGHGSPAVVTAMAALARRLGVADRVTFQASPRCDLPGVYRHADVVLFPSEWPEPFGLVPLEAMACGTPVVATGTGGSGEFLVDEVNCLRFPPRCPRALAAAVGRLADEPALRATIAQGGLATAREMTLDRYAERLEQLHVAAVTGPAPSPLPTVGAVPPERGRARAGDSGG
jgi:glycogen(starch) synthase